MITDHLMLDVLRSTTTAHGALCVIATLTTPTQKSHATCSDFGEFLLSSVNIFFNIFIRYFGHGVNWVGTPSARTRPRVTQFL